MDRVRSAAELKSIRLVRGGPMGLQVIGDKQQLVTAVNNLIDNAVAYSPKHTRVAVGVREREDSVEITVSDQGIGIPEDEQARIFERFYRVDPARSRQTGGTGLGLSIVKHIAAAHRGSVSVWSSHGAGSTFTLRLPRHPLSAGTTTTEKPPAARPSVTKGSV
jgi:two-component system sensor histidine kinase SenX3